MLILIPLLNNNALRRCCREIYGYSHQIDNGIKIKFLFTI